MSLEAARTWVGMIVWGENTCVCECVWARVYSKMFKERSKKARTGKRGDRKTKEGELPKKKKEEDMIVRPRNLSCREQNPENFFRFANLRASQV